MFDIGTKIKRAWNMIWRYKVLWIFAFLFVLFGGAGGFSGGGGNSGYRFGQRDMQGYHFDTQNLPYNTPAWVYDLGTFFQDKVAPLFMPDRILSTILWIIAIMFGVCILVGLLTSLVRYPAETAIMRMTDDYEETGSKIKFKQGWKLGWNRRAFRIWLIDLIFGAPAAVIGIGVAVGVSIFVVNMVNGDVTRQIPGMLGLFILAGFLFLLLAVVMVFVGVLRQYIVRAIAIDEATVGDAFKRGWAMMAHNFKNTFLTWLVMLGIKIGFGIAMILVLIVLIPVFILLMIPGAVVAAIPAAIAFGISSIFSAGFWAWIIAALVAMPFFFLVVFSPTTLIGGLFNLFSSSIWTQTYREMKNTAPPPVIPVVETTTSNL
jgi:hypothetical protein